MRNTGFFTSGILICWYGSLILNGFFKLIFVTAYLFKTQIINSHLNTKMKQPKYASNYVAQGFFLPNTLK